jgi:hypothetical protein
MDEKNSNGKTQASQGSQGTQGAQSQAQVQRAVEDNARVLEQKFQEAPATEEAASVTLATPKQESRQAYGTAKTENLRDSGLWRILLPGFVVLCCLALLAIPLIILTPLFINSLGSAAAANKIGEPITWVWIVMIIVVVTIAVIVIRGLIKIFMTSAGNY